MAQKPPRPGTNQYRQRLIKHILATKAGVYGAEVCQHCGEIKTFQMYWSAVFAHLSGEFVCTDCTRSYVPDADQIGLNSNDVHRASEELRSRNYRFCEVCKTRIRVDEGGSRSNRIARYWLCSRCKGRLLSEHGPDKMVDALQTLIRRRYLDVECRTDKQLRDFDIMVHDMRFTLDEGWGGPPKPGLRGTRSERWKKVLRELGEIHGRDYLAEKRQIQPLIDD